MIPGSQHQNRAYYDEDGNIIIPPGAEYAKSKLPKEEPRKEQVIQNGPAPSAQREKCLLHMKNVKENCETVWREVREETARLTQNLVKEGSSQYQWSFASAKSSCRQGCDALHVLARHIWAFLAQPVLVPRKRKPPRQHSRLGLFVLDVGRFGSTFAILFVGLFISLNYQSFWQIVKPHIDPLEQSHSANALASTMDATLKEKLLRSPMLATAGRPEGDLMSYLPPVGPPENRIIIPALGLNVPLVTPSYQSLLSEDWEQLEDDIQDALQFGIVHYPGTARPGQAGNFFVTGHSSYYPWASGKYKTVFARLPKIQPGDEYWVYYGGDKHRYIVRSKREVKPTNVGVLDQPFDKRLSTLMTCTPIGTTLRRLIITAEEVDPNTGIVLEVGEKAKRSTQKVKPQTLPI